MIQIQTYPFNNDLIEKGFLISFDNDYLVFPDGTNEPQENWEFIKVYDESILLYEGFYFKNERNGYGIEYYPKKGYYKGYFLNGKRQGKGIFVYEALTWFKEIGQFLSPDVQTMYISWLAQYQTATSQRAQGLEQKIRGMVVRHDLYRDFLF